MKSITISASEEDIWSWKASAVRERKRLGEWIRGRLKVTREAREAREPKEPVTQKGVEVSLSESSGLAEETKEPAKESGSEYVKRMEKANKDLAARRK